MPVDERQPVTEPLTTQLLSRIPDDHNRGDPWRKALIEKGLAAGDPGICLLLDVTVLGYAMLKQLPDRMEILNLVVFPLYRSKGYGGLLLQTIEDICRREGSAGIWLEVREGNEAAVNLYRSRGYFPVGRRPGYYTGSGPGKAEDAILMEKPLAATGETQG